jgi:hypothetical protein
VTQVTRFGRTIPILNKGAIGYDPDEVDNSEDTPDPVDLALGTTGSVAEVPISVGGSVALVQSASNTESLGSSVSATFGSPPTEGNLMVATIAKRDGGGTKFVDVLPSGWAEIDTHGWYTGNVGDGGIGQAFYKVAGPSETSSPSFMSTLGAADIRLCIMEFSGVGEIDVETKLSAQGPGTSMAIGPVTPTAGLPAIVLAIYVVAIADPFFPITPPAGFTEIDDDRVNPGGNLGPRLEVSYKTIVSTTGTYSATAGVGSSKQWGAMLLVLTPITGGFIWTTAPDTIDGDDATYDATALQPGEGRPRRREDRGLGLGRPDDRSVRRDTPRLQR